MNKRFASLAVSALLLVSLLSVPALAEGTEAAADAAGDEIGRASCRERV